MHKTNVQIRCTHTLVDQGLCFARYPDLYTFPDKSPDSFCVARFMSDLDGNALDRLSCNKAVMMDKHIYNKTVPEYFVYYD